MTSNPATIVVHTPQGGAAGNTAFALSASNGNSDLHVLINGASPRSDIPFSSLSSIEVSGRNGKNTFTVAAGLPVPFTVTG